MKAKKEPLGCLTGRQQGAGKKFDGCLQNKALQPDCQPLGNWFRCFFNPGEVCELRALGLTGKGPWEGWAKGTVSGYFDDPDKFAKAANALNSLKRAKGIYFTLNPVDPALLARANNRLVVPKATTTDEQIVCHRWLLIDTDPKRPSGISATDAELEAALNCRNEIAGYLRKNDWPDPLKAFSGNGGHLLYQLSDLPNSPEITELKRQALQALNSKFGGNGVDIDRAVFNASRICKLYGTWARKGDSTSDRPHRRSYLEEIPEPIVPVTLEQLQWLARQVPEDKHPHAQGQVSNGRKLDVRAYLSHYGVEISKIKSEGNRTIYGLRECIFNPEHTSNESAIVQNASGLLTYQCFHNSCQGRTWRETREKISGADSLAQFINGHNTPPTTQPTSQTKTQEWPDPDPIEGAAEERMPFPIEALPKIMQDAVLGYQAYGQQPLAMVVFSALATTSLAVQHLVDVCRDSELKSPCSLFFWTIAESGERKTASDKTFRSGLADWSKNLAEKMAPDIAKSKADALIWKSSVEGIERKIKKIAVSEEKDEIIRLRHELTELMENQPKIIKEPRLFYEDATGPSLGLKLAKGWPSGSVWSDEAGLVIGSQAMSKENYLAFITLINRLWDGNSFRTDRKTVEEFEIRGRRLTVSLMSQAAVFKKMNGIENNMARAVGFMARFLISQPESTMGSRPYKTPNFERAMTKFQERVKELIDLKKTFGIDGVDPVPLFLSPPAFNIWVDYHDKIEAELAPYKELFDLKDFAAKSAENASRIAGNFHTFENEPAGEIQAHNMERASYVALWYLNESRRIYSLIDTPQSEKDAVCLIKWLLSKKEDKASPREILQYGPNSTRRKEQRDDTLLVMKRKNWIRIESENGKKVIKINPKLRKDF